MSHGSILVNIDFQCVLGVGVSKPGLSGVEQVKITREKSSSLMIVAKMCYILALNSLSIVSFLSVFCI